MNKQSTPALRFWVFAAILLWAFSPLAGRAQEPTPEASTPVAATDDLDTSALGESAQAVQDLRALQDKTLIFVFDVSGSMRGDRMRRAREATLNILREGTNIGDRVVLFTFGAGNNKVFDEKLENEAERSALIEQVPSQPQEGAGTNIRRPHHEALKILEQELPHPGAVVLLTDSFNDEPKPTDPAYSDYLRYYTPGGRLTRYPDTPENRDYERLLAKLYRSKKVNMYGIGVQIDQSGRPVERLPQAAPVAEETTAPTGGEARVLGTPADQNQAGKGGLPLPLILGGLAAGALIGGLVYFLAASKPSPLRILGGPVGPKEYSLKGGQDLKIGGDGVQTFDAYPLPGTGGAAALLKGGSGGRFRIAPAPATPGAPAVKVFHNGLPLETEASLNYGDEVRVAVPDASGVGIGREFRLRFEDPTKSF